MGQEKQTAPAVPLVVPVLAPSMTQRTAGLKATVQKAGPVTGLAGRLGKGDGEPPKGDPPKGDPPKGEDPPKDPEKKDPPKDPKLERTGRVDRMGRVLADKDVAVPPKSPKGLADDPAGQRGRLGRP